MADIRFEEEHSRPQTFSPSRPRGLEALVIRLGLAPDRRGAQIVLIAVAVFLFVAAFFVLRSAGGGAERTFNVGNDPIQLQR